MKINPFSHPYYTPPSKEGETATVLCMRCASKIKGPGVEKEDVKKNYKEKKIQWITDTGVKGDGVLILCPKCVDLEIEEEYLPHIHTQIMNALRDEAEYAKLPMKTDLIKMRIIRQEAI